jgi:hypothetical protein
MGHIPMPIEHAFRQELLKVIGLPPELLTRGFLLAFPLHEIPTAEVKVLLMEDQLRQALEVLLRYRFTVKEIEVGSVVDLLAEEEPAPSSAGVGEQADRLSARLTESINSQIVKMRADIEDQTRRLAAPLVDRLGGTVSLSPEDLARPWSLAVLELPDGGLTLTAVALEEQRHD